MIITLPSHLTFVNAFESVQVLSDVREKTDQAGTQRVSTWANALGWIVTVELVRGQREKKLPNGATATVLDTRTVNVTVWANDKPQVAAGDYVHFDNLAVGAVEGNLYFQALGCKRVDEADSLENILGEGDA